MAFTANLDLALSIALGIGLAAEKGGVFVGAENYLD
jgi:hypothetical protein